MGHAFAPSTNIPTASTHSVSSTSSEILADNNIARYRCFKNNSTTVAIWLGLGVPAVVGQGICIEPRQNYEMALVYGNMYTNEVFAITESSSATVAILESQPNT